jgi:hypothetical protein
MKNKRRLIVLLLTLSMVLSQMSLVAFADNEAAGESDQTVTEQATVETAFDQTVTENGVDITVKAAEGVFPAGAELSAKSVDVPEAIDSNNALAFDIKILADGEEVQPKDNAKVEVSFKAAEVKKNETEVYHMDGNKADKLDVETKGTTATVETTGFSTYVLVFTQDTTGDGGSTISYSMGDNQEVELQTIVGNYKPNVYPAGSTNYQVTYTYADAKSSLQGKIDIAQNGTGQYCVKVDDDAVFDDGDEAYITIPYTASWTVSSTDDSTSGTIRINITIRDTSEPGTVVAPTAKEGLIYSGKAQQLINVGSATVGTMQYRVGTGTWIEESTGVVDIKGTNAGDYTVYWRVVLQNGTKTTTVDSGEITATINKKAATLTVQGGTSTYTGTAVDIATAANVAINGLVNSEQLNKDTDYRLTADPATIKEVGDYYIDAEAIDTSAKIKNYDLTIVPGTYTVTEKSASTITAVVTTNNGTTEPKSYVSGFEWVYDGAKHGIVVTPKAGETAITNATVYYGTTVLNSRNFSTEGVTDPETIYPKDAGTHPIYYYIIADGYAPLAGSKTVKIDKAYLRATINTPTTAVTYGDTVDFANQSWQAAIDAGNVTFKAYKEQTETTALDNVDFDTIDSLDQLAFDMGGYTDYMSDAGKYTIKLKQNLTSDNYIIRCKDGVLTVNPKPVSFTWSTPAEWAYDGKEHSVSAKINQDDLVGSDKQSGQVTINYVDDQAAYTNSATEVRRVKDATDAAKDWEVGSYTAKVLSLDGPRGHNYTFYKTAEEAQAAGKEFTSEKEFKITPVDLTLTPNAVTTVYGDEPKDNGYTATGMVNDEKAEDVLLGTPVQYAFTGTKGSDVGTYDISITNVVNPNTKATLHAQNYTVKTEANEGGQTITKRPVTMIWSTPKTFEYDGHYHKVTVDRVDNDYAAASAKAGASYVDAEKIDAGKYTAKITLSTDAKKNYEVKDASDEYAWEITQRPATIYVNNNTITYGQAPADKGYYVANKSLVHNDAKEAMDTIADKVELVPNYSKNGKPGSYAITAKLTNPNKNYRIVAIKQGTLTVNDIKTVLNAKGTKKGKRGILVSWDGVSGAVSYDVYMSLCNTKKKSYTPVYVGSTYGNSLKVTKIGKKKLKAKKAYKYYVVAKNASGAVIAQSQLGHFITNNVKGKKVNAKSMAVNTHVVSIGKGGTAGLSASYTKAKKGKKYKLLDAWHAPLTRYVSENPAVATVDANGVVYGVGSGWTRVYVMGVSGMWETVEVYVN